MNETKRYVLDPLSKVKAPILTKSDVVIVNSTNEGIAITKKLDYKTEEYVDIMRFIYPIREKQLLKRLGLF